MAWELTLFLQNLYGTFIWQLQNSAIIPGSDELSTFGLQG